MSNQLWFNTTIRNGYESLSNFANTPFELDGINYRTSEHYYQSMKFTDTDKKYSKFVNAAATPGGAKIRGSDKSHPLPSNWESTKVGVMKTGLKAKFSDPKLKKLLLSTGSNELIEHSYKDRFWGRHPSGVGENNLGKVLMEIREELKEE
jgi:ribA/ribD-fused uncharacterized protein